MIRPVLFALLAYLAGSVPTGYLVGRWSGVDLRDRGSGNLGSSNVFRVLGPVAAAPVLLVDMLKGFLPVWYFPLLDGTAVPHLPLLYGVAAIAGHVWSVFLRFQGGKGIATAGGVLFALSPVTGLVAVLGWGGLVLVTGAPSVASLATATLLPAVAWWLQDSPATVVFALGIVPFAWWTHRDNVARLRRGDELRVRRRDAAEGLTEGSDAPGDGGRSR